MSGFYQSVIEHYALEPEWLGQRMLFLSGPRQIGKTTYAKKKIKELGGTYYNWDDTKVKRAYTNDSAFFTSDTEINQLVVFDEIHKTPKWKNILKGIFDSHRDHYQFIITGSAKLDTFRRSGDSLVGRYFMTHMLPISLKDLSGEDFMEPCSAESLIQTAHDSKSKINHDEIESLIRFGGFPEPFFSASDSYARRWQKQHGELLIREDLRDLSSIHMLDGVELLAELLEKRISTSVSINSLVEALEVDDKTVKNWISKLEKVMMIFSLKPWSKNITNSLRKSAKYYFYDWAKAQDPGARIENFVAMQLYRSCTLWTDRYGHQFDLQYLRTYKDEEVDFLITKQGKPWLIVEAKLGQADLSPAIYKFRDLLKVPAVLVSNVTKLNSVKNGVHLLDYARLAKMLS